MFCTVMEDKKGLPYHGLSRNAQLKSTAAAFVLYLISSVYLVFALLPPSETNNTMFLAFNSLHLASNYSFRFVSDAVTKHGLRSLGVHLWKSNEFGS